MNAIFKMIIALSVFMSIGTLFHINEIDNGTLLSYILWFVVMIVASQLEPNEKSLKFLLLSFVIESFVFLLFFIVFKKQ